MTDGVEKISLLIVEDDANIRYLLEAAALRAEVFGPVTTAPDGRAALDWLKQCDAPSLPEFIVTDLCMPRMTGIELVRELKADITLRSIPVGMITSSDVPNDRKDALVAGACSFVNKPHGLEALTKALLTLRASCGRSLARQHNAA